MFSSALPVMSPRLYHVVGSLISRSADFSFSTSSVSSMKRLFGSSFPFSSPAALGPGIVSASGLCPVSCSVERVTVDIKLPSCDMGDNDP